MLKNRFQLERGFYFPRTEGAVSAIENDQLDSRFEIEKIELTYSDMAKLRLFGFFEYSSQHNLVVPNNNFVKIGVEDIDMVVESALRTKKQVPEKALVRTIDKFVQKAKLSGKFGFPIWFKT